MQAIPLGSIGPAWAIQLVWIEEAEIFDRLVSIPPQPDRATGNPTSLQRASSIASEELPKKTVRMIAGGFFIFLLECFILNVNDFFDRRT